MRTKKITKIEWTNYLFIIIPVIIIIFIMIIPFFKTIYYSFTKFLGFSNPVFVGFKNYAFLAKNSHFLNAIKNNFLISLSTPIWVGLPLILAVILFQNPGRLLKIARMSIMVPFALSMSIVGIIFHALFHLTGPINTILENAGLGFMALDWIGNSNTALPLIIITAIWKDLGVYTIIFLAGLSNVNMDIVEAARIDGANWYQEFRHVIIPQLNPVIVFVVAMTLIGDFRYMFDYVYNITQGGPGFATETIEFLLYNEAFRYFNMGFASTLGIIIFVIIVIMTLLQIKVMSRND